MKCFSMATFGLHHFSRAMIQIALYSLQNIFTHQHNPKQPKVVGVSYSCSVHRETEALEKKKGLSKVSSCKSQVHSSPVFKPSLRPMILHWGVRAIGLIKDRHPERVSHSILCCLRIQAQRFYYLMFAWFSPQLVLANVRQTWGQIAWWFLKKFNEIAGSYDNSVKFFEELPECFPQPLFTIAKIETTQQSSMDEWINRHGISI